MPNKLTEETELTEITSKRINIARLSFTKEGVVVTQFDDEITISVDDVKELALTYRELTGGEVPLLSLVITGIRNNISTEAFAYSPYEELQIKQRTIAEAVVIKNIATRIMANFYYKVAPRAFPVKMFDTKEKALEWLFTRKNELN